MYRKWQPHIKEYTEYNALREEMLARLSFMNSYSYNVLTIIIALWVAGFSLIGVRFGLYSQSDNYIKLAFIFGESIAFFMVIPIVHSYVIKNDENIRQIASIGAYLRVFYECIPIVKHEESFFLWENVDSSLNLTKITSNYSGSQNDRVIKKISRFIHMHGILDFYTSEYFFMEFASFVFWVMSFISFLSIENSGFPFFIVSSCIVSSCIVFIVYVICAILIFCSMCIIRDRYNAPKRFKEYYKQSVKKCVENAKKQGCIDDDDETLIYEMLKNQ